MSRTFVAASSQFLQNSSGLITATPLTLATWFQATNTTALHILLSLGNSLAAFSRNNFQLRADGATAGDPITAYTGITASSSAASSTAGYSSNTWHHAAGVFASATDRRAFLNGTNKGTNATNRVPTGIDRTNAGGSNQLTTSFMDGRLAEAAAWNVALADDEIAMLGRGFSPLLVRPQSLVAYWPLFGRQSPEIDPRGRFELTVTGATQADHCRTFRPRRSVIHTPSSGGGTLPVLGALSAAGGIRQATISQIVTTANDIWGLLVARSATSGFTPARPDIVGVVEWSSSPIVLVDQDVTPGVYFYRTSAYTSDGQQTAWTGQQSATVQ
jgi:hypothetical protein